MNEQKINGLKIMRVYHILKNFSIGPRIFNKYGNYATNFLINAAVAKADAMKTCRTLKNLFQNYQAYLCKFQNNYSISYKEVGLLLQPKVQGLYCLVRQIANVSLSRYSLLSRQVFHRKLTRFNKFCPFLFGMFQRKFTKTVENYFRYVSFLRKGSTKA